MSSRPRRVGARGRGIRQPGRGHRQHLDHVGGGFRAQILLGDVGWLVQILNNLLANALKFTTEGQVQCEATWDEGSGLRLAVRDTGAGIPQADLERILLPFEQSTKEELRVANEGVGLGLAITKRLIELQQGEFQVESTLGEGSTFVVRLPLGVPEGDEGWWSPRPR